MGPCQFFFGFMGFYGILWDFMGFYEILWDFMGFYGILWDFIYIIFLYNIKWEDAG